MARVVLIQLWPRDPDTGGAVPLRIAGGGSAAYRQLGFNDWRAGITNEPRYKTSIGVDQTGLTGSAIPQAAGIRFFPTDTTLLSAVASLFWTKAAIQVNIGDDENPGETYPVTMRGSISDMTVEDGAMVLTFADLSLSLSSVVAPDVFKGTGDLEGGDDATGRVKRRTFGYAFNVEGRLLDKAYNIYEFGDPNRKLSSIPAIKDKGRAADTNTVLAWQGSALATLQALRNTTPPSGGAVLAPSISCAKWWTVPAGPLTADLRGEDQISTPSVPTLVQYLVGLFAPTMTITNLSDAQAFQSAVAGVHVDDASETAASLLDRLCLPVSLVWVVNGDGTLTFRRMTWAGPSINLAAREIARETVFSPLRYRRVGFQRNYRQHSDAEIAASLLLATDATYADGTPIETLKPASAGADKTSANTAAAVFGQGPGATAAGSAVLNDYATAISTTNRVKFSKMEKDMTGWSTYNPAGLSVSVGAGNFGSYRLLFVEFTATAANQQFSFSSSPMPVTALERLAVQAGFEAYGAGVGKRRLGVQYLDSSGNLLSQESATDFFGTSNFNTKCGAFPQTPSGAAQAVLVMTVYSGGSGFVHFTATEPMITSALANQSTFPTFTPGPNAIDGADVTNANVAAAVVGQGTGATASSLQQLDPSAAQALADKTSSASRQSIRIGFGTSSIITKGVSPGGSIVISGQLAATASSNSNIRLDLMYRVAGGSYATRTGTATSVTPSEPGIVSEGWTITNNSGVSQIYEVACNGVAGNSSVVNAVPSQSFLTA